MCVISICPCGGEKWSNFFLLSYAHYQQEFQMCLLALILLWNHSFYFCAVHGGVRIDMLFHLVSHLAIRCQKLIWESNSRYVAWFQSWHYSIRMSYRLALLFWDRYQLDRVHAANDERWFSAVWYGLISYWNLLLFSYQKWLTIYYLKMASRHVEFRSQFELE